MEDINAGRVVSRRRQGRCWMFVDSIGASALRGLARRLANLSLNHHVYENLYAE
jgi:hypothetical protein